jgi:hypothetical protein
VPTVLQFHTPDLTCCWIVPSGHSPALGTGLEHRDLMTLVPPLFGRLTVFDPRLPHGVRLVRGTQDPRKGRLVLHGGSWQPCAVDIGAFHEAGRRHIFSITRALYDGCHTRCCVGAGWFTDPTPFCQGGLSTEEVQGELDAALAGAIGAMQGESGTLVTSTGCANASLDQMPHPVTTCRMASCHCMAQVCILPACPPSEPGEDEDGEPVVHLGSHPCTGMLSYRLHVDGATGQVTSVRLLADTLVGGKHGARPAPCHVDSAVHLRPQHSTILFVLSEFLTFCQTFGGFASGL